MEIFTPVPSSEKGEIISKRKILPKIAKILFLILADVILSLIYFFSVQSSPNINGKPIPPNLSEIKSLYSNIYTIRFLATIPALIVQIIVAFFIFKLFLPKKKALIMAVIVCLLISAVIAFHYFSRYRYYTQSWGNLISYVQYPKEEPKISGTFGCIFDAIGPRKIEFAANDDYKTVRSFYEQRLLSGYTIEESHLTTSDYGPENYGGPEQEIPGIKINYVLHLGNNSFGPGYSVDILPEENTTKIIANSDECNQYQFKATSFITANSNSSVILPEDETANWKSLTSEDWGFSLKYPPALQLTTQTVPTAFKIQTPDFEFDESSQTTNRGIQIYLQVTTNIGKTITIDDYLKEGFLREIRSPADTQLDGVKAKRFFSHFDKYGAGSDELVAIKKNKVYWFIVRSNTDSFFAANEVFNRILSSFKFIDMGNESASWKIYKNDEIKFSLNYPPDWIIEFVQVQTKEDYKQVTLKGKEGYLDILWGSGFGGACPQGYEDIQIKTETLKVCHGIDTDGSESWGGFSKDLGYTGFTANATAYPPHEANREIILKIISSMEFKQ